MVIRRAVMTVRRGTWTRDYDGFVFSVDEKTRGASCWYFVPDSAENQDLGTFYRHTVAIHGPNHEPKFQPDSATLVDRCEAEEMVLKLREALEGLL